MELERSQKEYASISAVAMISEKFSYPLTVTICSQVDRCAEWSGTIYIECCNFNGVVSEWNQLNKSGYCIRVIA